MLESPSQGLKSTLPVIFAPVPPGLREFAGPELLPHQFIVAVSWPVAWLFWMPVVSPEKLSLVAVRFEVSFALEPTTMPVVAPIVLSVIVAEPSFSTEAPTLKPVMATLSAERLPPLTSIAVNAIRAVQGHARNRDSGPVRDLDLVAARTGRR